MMKIQTINKEVTRDAFAKSLVWMEHNQGKPDFQKDSDGDELQPKVIVSWSQLDNWEKKCVDIPVSEMFPFQWISMDFKR